MPVDIPESGDAAARSPVQVFEATFREALLTRTAFLLSDQAEKLIAGVMRELEARAAGYDAGIARLGSLIGELPAAAPNRLGKLVEEYYASAYDLFLQSSSVVAFYRQSGELLRALTATLVGHVLDGMGLPAGKQSGLALIALGPAGRQEFSPFCSVQLLLVHAEAETVLAEELGQRLHAACESIGLRPDTQISPRNPEWRGTPATWRTRLVKGLNRGDARDTIQLLRLADQAILLDNAGLGSDFRRDCCGLLRASLPALHNLVERISRLGSGITWTGRARLERIGPHAGMFKLLDHALVPLSAALSALSLMHGAEAGDSLRRIGELRDAKRFDPALAEQLRDAWQHINELRLLSEALKQSEWSSQDLLCPPVAFCAVEEPRRLVPCLRTITQLRRQVEISYEQREEQVQC
jgi:CBS domain-containing protein